MSSRIIVGFENDTYAEEHIESVRQMLIMMMQRDPRLEKSRITIKSEADGDGS